MTEWRPSGPEPAKDGPGNLSGPAQTAINRPEGRSASQSASLSEPSNAPGARVIILTALAGPDGDQKISREDGRVPGPAPFPGHP